MSMALSPEVVYAFFQYSAGSHGGPLYPGFPSMAVCRSRPGACFSAGLSACSQVMERILYSRLLYGAACVLRNIHQHADHEH